MKKQKKIFIKLRCLKTILRLAGSSWKEIGFVCAGRNGVITKVVRLRNTASRPRRFYFWNEIELKFVMKELKRHNLKYISEGHSHPGGQPYPSGIDVRWMKKGHIEFIAATDGERVSIKAWKIKRTYWKTRTHGQVPLIVC